MRLFVCANRQCKCLECVDGVQMGNVQVCEASVFSAVSMFCVDLREKINSDDTFWETSTHSFSGDQVAASAMQLKLDYITINFFKCQECVCSCVRSDNVSVWNVLTATRWEMFRCAKQVFFSRPFNVLWTWGGKKTRTTHSGRRQHILSLETWIF